MNHRICLGLVLLVVVSACGGDTTTDDEVTADSPTTTTTVAEVTTTTTVATTSTTAATTTTMPVAEAEGMIPDPASGATLVPYGDENITTGDVFVYWYRDTVGGNYVVLYAGPGIAGAAGQALCPGNSIAAPDFMHISNTPVEEGSCEEGFDSEPASVQVCSGGVWLYRTNIPGDLEGTLYGSLEWTSADGTVKGLTSQFPTSPDLPELQYGLASYALWEGFTSDGSTVVTCSNPSA